MEIGTVMLKLRLNMSTTSCQSESTVTHVKNPFISVQIGIWLVCDDTVFEILSSHDPKHAGHGCPSCGIQQVKASDKTSANVTRELRAKAFIEKANHVHNFSYDYTQALAAYQTMKLQVPIQCLKCKHTMLVAPKTHLQGRHTL